MMSKKNIISIVIVVLIVVMGAGIWLSRQLLQVQPKFTGPVEEVSIALTTNALSALIWVADAQGYFADYGLDVTLRASESGLGTIAALFDREVDLATIFSGLFLISSTLPLFSSTTSPSIFPASSSA